MENVESTRKLYICHKFGHTKNIQVEGREKIVEVQVLYLLALQNNYKTISTSLS